MSRPNLLNLMLQTLRDPREGANTILSLGVPKEALWPAALLVVIFGAIIGGVSEVLAPAQIEGFSMPSPWVLAIIRLGFFVIGVFALFWMGRTLDGKGSLDETVLVIAWWAWLFFAGQLAVIALVLVSQSVAFLVLFGFVIYMIYVLVVFIDVLHSLNSMGRAAMMLGLAVGAIILGMAFLISLTGIGAAGGFASV